MKLTSRTRYGVRALFDIAYHGRGRPMLLRDIAERQAIPMRFLEQIFRDLKRVGMVESRRGPGGGYLLARSADAITLGDILRAIEGPISFGRCVHLHEGLVQAHEHITGRCVTGEIWDQLGGLLTEFLDQITVEGLCTRGYDLGIVRSSEAVEQGAAP